MSDFTIQDTPAVPDGAQEALQADAEQKSRNGFVGSQVFRSFPPSPNVVGRAASLIAPAQNTRETASINQMAVDSPVAPNVKPVDRRTIEGSTPGDFRVHGDWAKASLDKAADNGGPRQPAGQFPNSGRTPDAK